MLNYNSPINENRNHSNLILSEIEPTIKINLRSKKKEILAKIGKSLSIIPPTEPNTSSSNDILNILWLSPDEWMIYSNNTNDYNYKLEDNLYNEVSKLNYGSITNVSEHWIMINMKGDKVYELLSSSCHYNFNEFKNKKGSVVQTILNHIDVIIHNKDINNLNLFVRRSFSNHLWSWLNDSARFI